MAIYSERGNRELAERKAGGKKNQASGKKDKGM